MTIVAALIVLFLLAGILSAVLKACRINDEF
jgi:hypothetical protein